jgi:18S rRNA (guanine1575-N7)-methyltransferase
MTLRAIDLLQLPYPLFVHIANASADVPSFILDVGCGSGLSGEILTEEGNHIWVGMDIAPSMLQVALEREVEGDLLLSDIGNGIPFRPGSFDACISISVLQWLFNVESSTTSSHRRLHRFFATLFSALKRGGKAVLQFYPETDGQSASLMAEAKRAGFGGGIVVDYPDSKKARKYYLCLVAGTTDAGTFSLPRGLSEETERTSKRKRMEKKKAETRKEFIVRKKALYRKRGKEGVSMDSKYTGRKRRSQF